MAFFPPVQATSQSEYGPKEQELALKIFIEILS